MILAKNRSRFLDASVRSRTQFKSALHLQSIRAQAIVALLCLLSATSAVRAQDGPLALFKNYFVTGDYVVGGVGLRGQGTPLIVSGGVGSYATGVIHMAPMAGTNNIVPANADVVAAFLYWETIADASLIPNLKFALFRGNKVEGKQIAPANTAACRGSGGGGGNQNNAQPLLVFRADVLRFLPFLANSATGQPVGQRLVNDSDLATNHIPAHTVSIPDSGAGGTQSPSSGNRHSCLKERVWS